MELGPRPWGGGGGEVQLAASRDVAVARGRDAIGVSGTFHPVGVSEECADFAVVVAPPAVSVGVVAADVTTLADAGMVTVGVAGLADAGMVFPADLAGVVAADATTLADAALVTVGVAD